MSLGPSRTQHIAPLHTHTHTIRKRVKCVDGWKRKDGQHTGWHWVAAAQGVCVCVSPDTKSTTLEKQPVERNRSKSTANSGRHSSFFIYSFSLFLSSTPSAPQMDGWMQGNMTHTHSKENRNGYGTIIQNAIRTQHAEEENK